MSFVLIAEDAGSLKGLVVIDSKHAGSKGRALRNQTARFWRVISRARMAEGPIGLKAVKVRCAYAARDAVEFRIVPGDRERDGGVQERTEVVCVMRVLPKIIRVNQQNFSNRLLKAGIELVTKSRLNGH